MHYRKSQYIHAGEIAMIRHSEGLVLVHYELRAIPHRPTKPMIRNTGLIVCL